MLPDQPAEGCRRHSRGSQKQYIGVASVLRARHPAARTLTYDHERTPGRGARNDNQRRTHQMRGARARGAARPTCNECTPEWQRERVDSTFGYDARMHLLRNGLRVLASALLAALSGCSVVPGYASSDAH